MCQKHPVSEAGDASGPSFPNIPSHGAAEVLMCQKLPVPEAVVASNRKTADVLECHARRCSDVID